MTRSELPDLNIRMNGTSLPAAARADIRSVSVEEDLGALSMFTIDLYNWDDEKLRVSWSDSPFFAVGNQVEISLGYVDDLHKVMTAEITSLEPTFAVDQIPRLTVRGYDHRHRLARARKSRPFRKIKDSAIAGQLAREAGLRAAVKDSQVVHDWVAQSNQTDLEFLQQRAKRIGYEVYVRDKTLYFQPPQSTRKAGITLSLDGDITEFRPRLGAASQVGEVVVRGWDVKQKKEIVGRAGIGQESSSMGGRASGPRAADRALGKGSIATVTEPVGTQAEADQIAKGRFNELALNYIRGDVTCHGLPQLHAGIVVEITGAGKTFSGPYYVTSAVHRLTPDGYETNLSVRRNAA